MFTLVFAFPEASSAHTQQNVLEDSSTTAISYRVPRETRHNEIQRDNSRLSSTQIVQ